MHVLSRSYNEAANESDTSGLFTNALVKVLDSPSEHLTVFEIHERVLTGWLVNCFTLGCVLIYFMEGGRYINNLSDVKFVKLLLLKANKYTFVFSNETMECLCLALYECFMRF